LVQQLFFSSLNLIHFEGWLELEEYYISAFKLGSYPSITRDRIFLWARLYPANVDVPGDLVGKPYRWQYVSFCPISTASLAIYSLPPPLYVRFPSLILNLVDARLSLGSGVFNRRRCVRYPELRRLL
jgi:hypothetical protein